MAQIQKLEEIKQKEKEEETRPNSSCFKFNAGAPEFVPTSHTQIPVSGYFYPCFNYVVVAGNDSPNWVYVAEQDPFFSNPDVMLPDDDKHIRKRAVAQVFLGEEGLSHLSLKRQSSIRQRDCRMTQGPGCPRFKTRKLQPSQGGLELISMCLIMAGTSTPTMEGDMNARSPDPPPIISDMIELTPEGVRENFSRLQELIDDYVQEERLRGVRVRLAYDEEPSVTLTPGPPQEVNPGPEPHDVIHTSLGLLNAPREESQAFAATPVSTSMPGPILPAIYPELYRNQVNQWLASQAMAFQFSQGYIPEQLQMGLQPSMPNYTQPIVPISFNPSLNHYQYPYHNYPWQAPQFSYTQPLVSVAPAQNLEGLDDDLSRPYMPEDGSKFSQRIANFKFPPKTKMPANVKTYDGLGDPDDHLELFTGAAKVEQWSMPIWCHMFAQTLSGPARLWFNSLPPGSIDSFRDLKRSFQANFMQQKRYTRDPVELHNIKQRDDEDLRAFMERYKLEGLSIGGATEQMRISGFIHGVRPRQLIEDLNRHIPKTMEEAMERAESFIRGKEAAQSLDTAKKGRSSGWRDSPQGKPSRFQPFVERRSQNHGHESRRPYDRSPYSRTRGNDHDEKVKSDQFTALIKSPQEILATEEARFSFQPPRPLPKAVDDKNSHKYCDFHGGTGHYTNDCFQLKKRIEAAVKSGELAHLIKDLKGKKQYSKEGEKEKDRKKGKEIMMVSGSSTRATGRVPSMRPIPRWAKKKISFPPLRHGRSMTSPVIIEADIEGHTTQRVYLDGGSSSEVMYEHCFLRLDEDLQRRLVASQSPLISFSGETVQPIGEIKLKVSLGQGNFERTEMLNFIVVRSPSRYNVIIGRPGISAFFAVVSTAHGMVKIPSKAGVFTLRPPREQLVINLTEIEEVGPGEGRVVINQDHPDQTVCVGRELTESGLRKLVSLLRASTDVFAWSPSDMTGVPRYIAEHTLNIPRGHTPVVQKKRGLAQDRAHAVRTEVDKLVSAGIMKEVKYPTWVANPVIVRKHDGTWRMCVDFKDLNKACPKDCYPLPEIDLKVDSLTGHSLKCFLDAYKGYHQVQMKPEDEEKTAFHTTSGIYCYKKMPFEIWKLM
ncbi:hypothetical protein QVD17_27358 [Tagetes erecta]|uniref:Retrotransposon gag domain-containing protein n=1 Tax=Tagetes erecta TaxID=13708 RepID=A0AAD8NJE4_TARER|nr:hypothetical protein QVD17_27358 [Tagetes erecta]